MLLYFNCTVLSQGVNNQSYSIAAQQRTKQKYVSLHIQSECGKIWTRITPNMGTFDAVDELSWGLLRDDIWHNLTKEDPEKI